MTTEPENVRDGDVHVVHVEPSNPRPGWCGNCSKPALVTFDILTLAEDGVGVIDEASGCADCGSGIFADGDT
ncbi:hypothetical protein K1W54_04645 [Micromonospora sp. CPCC 205371]|nr:hypothetical protein [Micromonospora sp. CPCC 205371]